MLVNLLTKLLFWGNFLFLAIASHILLGQAIDARSETGQFSTSSDSTELAATTPGKATATPSSGTWTISPQYIKVKSDKATKIYYTIRSTINGSNPSNPPDPSPSLNDGNLSGSSGDFKIFANSDENKKLKVKFRGYNSSTAGPVSDVFNYSIDARTAKVWAEYCADDVIPLPGVEGRHIYVIYQDKDGNKTGFGCFGRSSGGIKMNGTVSSTQSNQTQVKSRCDDSPCKWPHSLFAVEGVCHQLSNRGLSVTGKTIDNASSQEIKKTAYGVSKFFYGVYGVDRYDSSLLCSIWTLICPSWGCYLGCQGALAIINNAIKPYTWSNCKNQTKATAEPEESSCSQTNSSTDPQIFVDDAFSRREEDPETLRQYRESLLEIDLIHVLKDRYSIEMRDQIFNLQEISLAKKAILDLSLLTEHISRSEFLQAFNTLTNDSLQEFRKILYDDEFIELLNIDPTKPFQWESLNSDVESSE